MISVEYADTVTHDLRDYPKRAQRILVRALNRGINSGRTFLQQNISKDMGMKSSDVRDALVMTQATFDRPEARIAASLKRIPLIQFGARGPEPSMGRGRGVSYKLPGGGRDRVANAFITTMPSGHRGVFARIGKGRLPIRELFGPSIGHVFRKYRAAARSRAEESFRTNLDHELSRLKD